ncbi:MULTISPECIES: dihydrolipoyl dehydrogenase [Sphingobium]|jgi:dihydrolipoamide dehydrogenase|uniref:dihydrolipoyl dehydrogenase n=1 Tax=Sphingobium TaxID=165695 RepID=UPI000C68BAAC|nr:MULTISPECIES: dihydrolipoyl dehydrogenase [Sphingobium]MEE2741559.1 dihydrolipoyl dehydrogenase [Pseudomonadota bacterium]MAP45812.1 dihydrolipoyl dehydrogenase [Sphingobium sp.]MAX14452.1 dihydrolipoyl dehydrogenase [Sphingobium sp.]MBS47831.1 dihydrolipoyl dehydrogenase [Sphingobium sp.]MCC4255698.1 dihydrolipoyl dehydrogenase [Sphingobium lactosutens]|tara:strand:+ start:4640 stop:6040 length:1401 start_codon:yes stop_codon:yes gene_type:complete
MAEFDYDVLVIGAGPGGYVAAIRAAQLGLKTACAESRETLGGTCLNVGCIPSKAMLHASELYDEAANGMLAKLGVKIDAMSLDLATMQGQRTDAVKGLTGGIEFLFKKNKVTWLKGLASFTGANSVEVGGEKVTAKNIVIATGSSVTPLPGVTIDNAGGKIVDSTGALELDKVPGHLVVVGGGVIGLEMGSVWRRLGAKVTVVEYLDQILPGMDGEVRKEANKIFKKQGFEYKLGTKVTGAEVAGDGVRLTVEPAAGGEAETIEADVVLVSIGRRPNTEGLGLDKIGLEVNQRGQIETDHDFATKVPGVWAIGDVVPGPMLAHKAEDEGIAVAENIAGMTGIVNHDLIPSVVYTKPEIAGVGLTEEAAKEKGAVKVGKFPMMANSRAKTNHEPEGFVKIIADAETDKVLGVWIIAVPAGTMIAQAVQAMEFGASSEDIAYTCHAHPTHSEAIKEAAMAVTGKPIHM